MIAAGPPAAALGYPSFGAGPAAAAGWPAAEEVSAATGLAWSGYGSYSGPSLLQDGGLDAAAAVQQALAASGEGHGYYTKSASMPAQAAASNSSIAKRKCGRPKAPNPLEDPTISEKRARRYARALVPLFCHVFLLTVPPDVPFNPCHISYQPVQAGSVVLQDGPPACSHHSMPARTPLTCVCARPPAG